MKQIIEKIQKDMAALRDEMTLKAHLGKAEAKDELAKLEKEFDSLLAKAKPLAEEAEKTAGNAGAALGMAAEELMAGLDRLRKLIK